MKALIVCTSVSHGNTRLVADAMGSVLHARVVTPGNVDLVDLAAYDLIGFGSGIYNLNFHRDVRKFVESVPHGQRARAFVFSTSGLPEPRFRQYSKLLADDLEDRGYEVVGTFSCRGIDTWWPFRPLGGIRKGRPDAGDIEAAGAFARALLDGAGAPLNHSGT
ncbi:flavodoxin family protein [Gordonia terrae]|uniref:flavodoxin family protein n=1 Tax=Gordonia terrae TaxID=2055 RepID=UPI003F6C8B14